MLGHRPEHPGRPPRWRPWALGSAAEGDERRGCEGRASARKNESKTRTWALPSRFLNPFGILDSFSLDRANRGVIRSAHETASRDQGDRKSPRLKSSHYCASRIPSSSRKKKTQHQRLTYHLLPTHRIEYNN